MSVFMIQELLQKLSTELSLDPAKQERENSFSFSLNKTITLHLRDLEPGLSLYSPIIQCGEKRREELFIYLMQANLLGQGTGGGRIALDFEEKTLTLLLGLPYEMNYQLFKEMIENFANHLIFWRNEIERFTNEKTLY